MSNILAFNFSLLLIFSTNAQLKTFPAVEIQDMNQSAFNTSEFSKPGKITLVVMWATSDRQGIMELDELQEVYTLWQKNHDLKIVAVAIEGSGKRAKTNSFIESRGWKFDFYMDTDESLIMAVNAQTLPMSFLINAKGQIVWQKSGYTSEDLDAIKKALSELK